MAESSGGCASMTNRYISQLDKNDVLDIMHRVKDMDKDISIFAHPEKCHNFHSACSIFG